MSDAVRAVWDEPRPSPVPRAAVRDRVLAAAFVAAAVGEVALRPQLPWRFAGLAAVVVLAPTLLVRRTRPLAAALAGVGVGSLATVLTGGAAMQLFSFAFLLVVPHALARWGSGREAVVGAAAMAAQTGLSALVRHTGSDLVGGLAVLLAALALGVTVRTRAASRQRAVQEERLRERERLARDLHDTVAHHVSAIAIRAQAGLAVADVNPAAAADALRTIEGEASRALAEMRSLVKVLRAGEPDREAELAPGPSLSLVPLLAAPPDGPGPRVDVTIDGDVGSVGSAVGAAVYRMAQEAVTNARRHAVNATRVDVRVRVDADRVHLTVRDDGEPPAPPSRQGHGLAGMAERAQLLGGRCQAGPSAGASARSPAGSAAGSTARGWSVEADLPRTLAP